MGKPKKNGVGSLSLHQQICLTQELNQGLLHCRQILVTKRLKGLDLIECLMNYGWRFVTLYMRQGSRQSPWKRKAKMAVWGDLTNSCEKKRSEKQRRKGKI